MNKIAIVTALFAAHVVWAENEAEFTWGGRVSHPAVVNSVVGESDVLSLRGEWEFCTPKPLPNRNGVWGQIQLKDAWPNVRKIQVPSCWEAQGIGETGQGDIWQPVWDNCQKAIRNKYLGEAWYRKTVTIPKAWEGRRIWIKIGGVKSVAWVWINGQQVAHVGNYCGTEKFDITDLVKAGESAKIVFDVSNLVPSRKGLMSALHRFGGIYRDVELEATPMAAWIDDAWVRGNFDRGEGELHVDLGRDGDAEADLAIVAKVEGREWRQPIAADAREITLKMPLKPFRAWSPEHPNLYTAEVALVDADGRAIQRRIERFGVKKLEVRGKDFYLNGKLCFLRGFGDDHVYPLTGMSPADVEVHRHNLAKAHAAGFNFVRLHTHCELPEYFEAADEMGIMVMPELPYYSDVPGEGFEFDPKRDATELYRNFRRYVSFSVYSMGNEGSFGPRLDAALHKYIKAMDPDRLKINQDCHKAEINPPEGSTDKVNVYGLEFFDHYGHC